MSHNKLITIPKIDAHMHIWDLAGENNPWLTERGKIDFRYGDYKTIRKNYLLDDYRQDFSQHHIIGSVFVETEWTKWQIEDEVHFVEQHNTCDFIKAIICQGWLDQSFEKQLAVIKKHPLVRGVRQKPTIINYDHYRVGEVYLGTMLDPDFIKGLLILAENDLIFEVQTAWWHLNEIRLIKDKIPHLKVVVNHAGMPQYRDKKTIKKWSQALSTIANLDGIYIKISGFGEKARWEFSRNKVIYDTLLDTFNINQLLFASNFPVDKVVADSNTLMNGFYNALSNLTHSDINQIFYTNTKNLYHITGES